MMLMNESEQGPTDRLFNRPNVTVDADTLVMQT